MPRPRLVKTLVLGALALNAWGPLAVASDMNGPPRPPDGRLAVLPALLALAGLAGLFVGFLLGRWRLWRLLALLMPVATGGTLCWYVLAMLCSSDPTSDTAATVGALLLAPLLGVLFATLLSLAGLVGRLTRRLPS